MCIQANHFLADDMDKAMKHALETEEAPLGRQILDQLQDNLKIAAEDMIPICQDTGMAVRTYTSKEAVWRMPSTKVSVRDT